MDPSLYVASLNTALLTGGSETTVFVNRITTLTGETLNWANFSPFTKGYIVIDPEAQFGVQPEIVSFTGIDTSALSFTGCVRGLSAVSNTTLASNIVYHGTGTPVIISWGGNNISDLITYVQGLVSGLLGSASQSVAGSTKITTSLSAIARAKSPLVSQSSSTPNMTVKVNPFSFEYGSAVYGNLPSTANPPVLAQVTSSTITAPVSNPRIDLVVWTTSSSSPGSLAIRTGSEAASPIAPTPSNGDIVLASIFQRTTATKIYEDDTATGANGTNGYILQWYEPTVYLTSILLTGAQTTTDFDQTQTTENTAYAVGESNATGKHSIVAQSFIPTDSGIAGVTLYKTADTGSFTGTVKISVQASSGGNPSGTDLASYTISNAVWLKLNTAATFSVNFSTEYEGLTPTNTYWIVATPSTSDNSNHPNIGIDNLSAHSLTLKYNNSTDGWVTTASSALYFQTLPGKISKIVQTNSTDGLIPTKVRPYSLISIDTTTVTSTSSTADVVLYSKQLDGGIFNINSGLRFQLSFSDSVNGQTTFNTGTFKIKFNGTTVVTITGQALVASNAANGPITGATFADIKILNTGSLSSQIIYGTYINYMSTFNGTPIPSQFGTPANLVTGTSSVDTSEPILIEITGANSTASLPVNVSYNASLIEKIG